MLNTFTLNTKEFGKLHLTNVLFKYVYPISFICVDKFDCHYLFFEAIDDNDYCMWNVVKVTNEEYIAICNKKLSIQEAFYNSQKPFLFLFKLDYITNKITVSLLSKSKLSYLPEKPIYKQDEDEYTDNYCKTEIKEIEEITDKILVENDKFHQKLVKFSKGRYTYNEDNIQEGISLKNINKWSHTARVFYVVDENFDEGLERERITSPDNPYDFTYGEFKKVSLNDIIEDFLVSNPNEKVQWIIHKRYE